MGESKDIYERLGVTRVINASGNQTVLGGSSLSSGVRQAMDDANGSYVAMEDLLVKVGDHIAGLLGSEAALVTSGCFAALVQGTAAIMTGQDPAKISQLPDTTGMKNEFLLQKSTRYHYDRCISVPGGKLIEVGDDSGTTAEQMEDAIGPNTAGILFLATVEGQAGTLSLAKVSEIAKANNIALLVDAASVIYPVERMTSLPTSGADLVCFGAKYLGSSNSSGILCGKEDMVQAAMLNGFIAYEVEDNHAIGRGYKVDRQEVIGTAVAVEEWLATDHDARFKDQEATIKGITEELADLPHVQADCEWPNNSPWLRMKVELDEEALGKTAEEVRQDLRSGSPAIRTRPDGDGVIYMGVHTLMEGEDKIIASRLREELGGS